MTTFTLPLPAGELYNIAANGSSFPTAYVKDYQAKVREACVLETDEALPGSHHVHLTARGYKGSLMHLFVVLWQAFDGVLFERMNWQVWTIEAATGGKKGVEVRIIGDGVETGGIIKHRVAAYKLEG